MANVDAVPNGPNYDELKSELKKFRADNEHNEDTQVGQFVFEAAKIIVKHLPHVDFVELVSSMKAAIQNAEQSADAGTTKKGIAWGALSNFIDSIEQENK